MNIISRIYCRIFQGVFKAAIPFLPYTNPIVLDSTSELPSVLKQKNINNVFIVTDPDVYRLGLLDSLKAALENAKIKYNVLR